MKFLGFISFLYFVLVSILPNNTEKIGLFESSKQQYETQTTSLENILETTPAEENTKETTKETFKEKNYYKVIKVVDGDTFDVQINDKTERIRLIGLDTPETVDPRKPIQCFGIEASNKAKELLLNQSILLERDETQGDKDKYGRLLRYVFLKDGTNFILKMLEEGYGHEYTYDQPYKYQKEFKEAEKQASENELGLWSPKTCLTPKQNAQ